MPNKKTDAWFKKREEKNEANLIRAPAGFTQLQEWKVAVVYIIPDRNDYFNKPAISKYLRQACAQPCKVLIPSFKLKH